MALFSFFQPGSAGVFRPSQVQKTIVGYHGPIPTVVFDTKALATMWLYVNNCPLEIGWLGISEWTGDTIFVSEVLLFPQEVSPTTTVIDTNGLLDLADRLIEEGKEEQIGKIRFWGHSHVNMPCHPSGQDDRQMEDFKANGADYFVRGIFNKLGDVRLDVYDYKRHLVFTEVPWSVKSDGDELSERIARQMSHMVRERNAPAIVPGFKRHTGGGSKPPIGFGTQPRFGGGGVNTLAEYGEAVKAATDPEPVEPPAVMDKVQEEGGEDPPPVHFNYKKKGKNRHGR